MPYVRYNTNCLECGKPLTGIKSKYCCVECQTKAHRAKQLAYAKAKLDEGRRDWANQHGKRLSALKTVDEFAEYVYNNFNRRNK